MANDSSQSHGFVSATWLAITHHFLTGACLPLLRF